MSLLVTGRGESVSCYTFIFVNTLSRFVIRLKYPDWFLLYFHVREVLRCSFYCNLVFLVENFMMYRKRAKFLRLDRFERFHLPSSFPGFSPTLPHWAKVSRENLVTRLPLTWISCYKQDWCLSHMMMLDCHLHFYWAYYFVHYFVLWGNVRDIINLFPWKTGCTGGFRSTTDSFDLWNDKLIF